MSVLSAGARGTKALAGAGGGASVIGMGLEEEVRPGVVPAGIRLLPETVVNRIAAGEVVERPAAVVRELVENSLDAGATRIAVSFRQAGRALIRVEDNGCGMNADSALLALERHATSKLRTESDLQRIATLGFRGEALPSIASISRFSLRTRRSNLPEGTEVRVNAGTILERRECGMPPGTVVEVAHLFHAVPARRKFLKSDGTEAAHIHRLVRLYALAHPQVAFTLEEDGRTVFQTPACPSALERVREIWGRRLSEDLAPIPSLAREGMALEGLLSKPGLGRAARGDLQVFVNGRPVEGRLVSGTVFDACRERLPPGRFPYGFLFLTVAPAAIDVNIHPAKREVRFCAPGLLRPLILEAVAKQQGLVSPLPPAQPSAIPVVSTESPHIGNHSRPVPILEPPALDTASPPEPEWAVAEQSVPLRVVPAEPGHWRFMGLLQSPLHAALFETREGLVVLNWRAAHERILFERLEGTEEAVAVQGLLTPLPIELEPVEAAALESTWDLARECGFHLERFGRHYYRLMGLPEGVPETEAEALLRDWLAALRHERGATGPDAARKILAERASRRAARRDTPPGETELASLVVSLLQCRQPLTTPRGRPTLFEIPRTELARRLGVTG